MSRNFFSSIHAGARYLKEHNVQLDKNVPQTTIDTAIDQLVFKNVTPLDEASTVFLVHRKQQLESKQQQQQEEAAIASHRANAAVVAAITSQPANITINDNSNHTTNNTMNVQVNIINCGDDGLTHEEVRQRYQVTMLQQIKSITEHIPYNGAIASLDQFRFAVGFTKVFLMGCDPQKNNLWIHGPSGSGKTEDTMLLKRIFDCEVLEKNYHGKLDPQIVIINETNISHALGTQYNRSRFKDMLAGDGLIQVKNNVKTTYYPNARFVCESTHLPSEKYLANIARRTEFVKLWDLYVAPKQSPSLDYAQFCHLATTVYNLFVIDGIPIPETEREIMKFYYKHINYPIDITNHC